MPGAGPKPLHEFSGKKSLGVFAKTNKFRVFCHKIVDDKQFEYLIMSFILLSSFTMVFESPKAMENATTATSLEAVDVLFTVIFALEMCAKIVAYGLYWEDGDSYLKDPWNCMDGFIVVIGIVGKALSGADLEWVRALRTMRVLRPLRVISRVPELKVVVNALMNSLPGLGNVLMVSLLFWIIFGILGMQLFMGSFSRCDDGGVETKADCVDGWVNATKDAAWDSVAKTCTNPSLIANLTATAIASGTTFAVASLNITTCVGSYDETLFVQRTWNSDDTNFDNILNAMRALFEISTTEGWTSVMYAGVDARGPELAPSRDHQPAAAFFFVAFEGTCCISQIQRLFANTRLTLSFLYLSHRQFLHPESLRGDHFE